MDFEGLDGWRMYHGDVVPGFPRHPHRGFETVTLARHGFIDHSDSLGATARFGQGDVQWMTAGRGIVHAEMFPLRERHAGNRAELFQIWLNLPRASKMVDPHFTMLWSRSIPEHVIADENGRETRVVTVAGALAGRTPPAGPPDSWASRPDSDVAIWTLVLAPGARFTLPPAAAGSRRTLYFFRGDEPAPRRAKCRRRTRASRWRPAASYCSRTARPRARSCCCRAARSPSRWCSTARS